MSRMCFVTGAALIAFLPADGWGAWNFETIPASPERTRFTSVQGHAYTADGRPAVAFGDASGGWAHYAERFETGWEVTDLGTGGNGGTGASLEFDSHGNPGVAFGQAPGIDRVMKFAYRGSLGWSVCEVWRAITADRGSLSFDDIDRATIGGHIWMDQQIYLAPSPDIGDCDRIYLAAMEDGAAMTLDHLPSGVLLSAYRNSDDLHFGIPSDSLGSLEIIDSSLTTNTETHLVVSPAGRPHIAYVSTLDGGHVRLAHDAGFGWEFEVVTSGLGTSTSLAFTPSGSPGIAYVTPSGDVRFCFQTPSGWDSEHVYGSGVSAVALAFDPSGTPSILMCVGTSALFGKRSNSCPEFDYGPTPPDGDTLTVQIGETLSFVVQASDPDTTDVVTITETGLPAGADFSSSPGQTATAAVTWSPTTDDAGTYHVSFTATDGDPFCSRSTSIVIVVTEQPEPCVGDVLAALRLDHEDFTGVDPDDRFGGNLEWLGDLNGDGANDLVASAWGDDDGGSNRGAVWVLFLDGAGGVISTRKISDAEGIGGTLQNEDQFGESVASLGDLDGIGGSAVALAVGAVGDAGNTGAMWILFLDSDGSVVSSRTRKIANGLSGFPPGLLEPGDNFGVSAASLGDLDGPRESVVALAVGAHQDDDTGSIWILLLNSDGTVESYQKIPGGGGQLSLDPGDEFGVDVTSLGLADFPGAGALTIAVGAQKADSTRGAVWLLSLNNDGTLLGQQKIANGANGLPDDSIDPGDRFGSSVASLGDLDGIAGGSALTLAVGAYFDSAGGIPSGVVWELPLNSQGQVDSTKIKRIGNGLGGFPEGLLAPWVHFGFSLAWLSDDGSGGGRLAVGALLDDDTRGAVWELWLCGPPTVSVPAQVVSSIAIPFYVQPNPSSGYTEFLYDLPTMLPIRLSVYNVLGQHVATILDGVHHEGRGSATWKGTDSGGARVAPGVYFLRFEAPSTRITRKIVLLQW